MATSYGSGTLGRFRQQRAIQAAPANATRQAPTYAASGVNSTAIAVKWTAAATSTDACQSGV